MYFIKKVDGLRKPFTGIYLTGVFGAGKSYLLAVVVLFLVELFEKNEPYQTVTQEPVKLLVSSVTNVAVDRILMGYVWVFGSFGNEPMQSCSVRRVVLLSVSSASSVYSSPSDSFDHRNLISCKYM